MVRPLISRARPSRFFLLLLACGGMLALPVSAQTAGTRPETLIKWRQSAYQVMVWNTSRIRANLEGSFNREEVIRAATLLSALANGGMGSLYPTGTERGTGWRETRAKPEIFPPGSLVAERARELAREAETFLQMAQRSDVEALKAQYGRLSQACKHCHEDFKIRE